MSELNHHEYYVGRANASHALARTAASPYIADIHAELAARYESLATQTAPKAVGLVNPSEATVEIVLIEPGDPD